MLSCPSLKHPAELWKCAKLVVYNNALSLGGFCKCLISSPPLLREEVSVNKWSATVCPPEESVKQVKLNAALISYRCSHLPLSRDWWENTESFHVYLYVHSTDTWGMTLTECKLKGIYSTTGDGAGSRKNPTMHPASRTVDLFVEEVLFMWYTFVFRCRHEIESLCFKNPFFIGQNRLLSIFLTTFELAFTFPD